MIVFFDSSVLLRKLLGEPRPLAEWQRVRRGFVSALAAVEIGRVIDRLRLSQTIADEHVAHLHEEAKRVLASCDVVPVSPAILRRARAPMPTVLGTLDAIHLVSALYVAARLPDPVLLASHDAQLSRAARASGLAVLG